MLLLGMLMPAAAFAQFTHVDPLTITLSPQNPRPYETVTVTVNSTTVDLLSSSVRVSVNGNVAADGTGVVSVPVTVGGPGQTTTISVRVVSGGQTFTKDLTFQPADVSLIVDPVSTTHPFYEGASLPAASGRVRVIALPDLRTSAGTRMAPQNLSYTWKLGDQILTAESGIGRSVLVATAPVRYRDAQISVTVTSPDNPNMVAQAATVVSPVDPVVRVYRTDPLLGPLFNIALSGTYTLSASEESFRGVPYFFASAPSLSWSVNGQVSSSARDITLRPTGSGAGNASLSLSAQGTGAGQTASQQFSIRFGQKSTNLFGF